MNAVKQALGGGTGPAPPPAPATNSPPIKPPTNAPPSGSCKAVGAWAGNAAIDQWCVVNCAAGYCPASMCKCT